jgi:hypothetical protein
MDVGGNEGSDGEGGDSRQFLHETPLLYGFIVSADAAETARAPARTVIPSACRANRQYMRHVNDSY